MKAARVNATSCTAFISRLARAVVAFANCAEKRNMSSSKIADAAHELRELSAAELAIVAGGTFIIGTGGGKVPPPPPPPKGNVSHVRFLGPPETTP
jgi:hypothetical protein